MQRPQLEHVIRAAAGITGATEIVVIGSQAVLAGEKLELALARLKRISQT